jgi:hypothetical protein
MTHQPHVPNPVCLGCPECKGFCLALMELASLPETVLGHSAKR